MNLYDKILKLQYDYKIGVNEFLEISGFSKSMYYDIANGRKTELKPLQAKILNDKFPDFKIDWLSNSAISTISTDNTERQRATNDELFALDVMRRHYRMMETTEVYRTFIIGVASEWALDRQKKGDLDDLIGDD